MRTPVSYAGDCRRAAVPVLIVAGLLALPASASPASDSEEPEWSAALEGACDAIAARPGQPRQSLFGMPGGMIPVGPGGTADPWAGSETARSTWCAAMADTHQSDWSPGMIPGQVRGPGDGIDKTTETERFFEVVVDAFARLESATQPDRLRTHAREAGNHLRCEASVFRAYGWNYGRTLRDGATLSPPLGLEFAGSLSVHVVGLTQAQERWCWENPRDRG